MLDAQTLSMNKISAKDTGVPKPDSGKKDKDLSSDFLIVMQSLQSNDNQPFNLESLLNQSLTNEMVKNPKVNAMIEQLPEHVQTQFKKLIGTPINQILSDNKVSPKAKTLSIIAASYQYTDKTNQAKGLFPTNPNEEKLLNVKGMSTSQTKESAKAQQHEPFNTKSKEILRVIEQSINLSNKPTKEHTLTSSVINRKNFSNESLSYGEFKLNRTTTPVIQVNTADTPGQTQQNFMRQFETLLKSSRFSQIAKNHSQMTIQLRPDNLGFMTIKVEQVQQEMIARIITSSTMTKDLIESNLNQLRHLNIQVDKFDVQIQQSNNQLLRDQEQSQQGEQEEQKNNQTEDNEQSDRSFEEELENILP